MNTPGVTKRPSPDSLALSCKYFAECSPMPIYVFVPILDSCALIGSGISPQKLFHHPIPTQLIIKHALDIPANAGIIAFGFLRFKLA